VSAMLSSVGTMRDFDRFKQKYADLRLGSEQGVIILQNAFIPLNFLPLLTTRLNPMVVKDELRSDVCVVCHDESSFVVIYRPSYSQEPDNLAASLNDNSNESIYIYTFGDPKARILVIDELLRLCNTSFPGLELHMSLQYLDHRYDSCEIEQVLFSENGNSSTTLAYPANSSEISLVGLKLILDFNMKAACPNGHKLHLLTEKEGEMRDINKCHGTTESGGGAAQD
jgi:hypothetical protein